MINCGLVWSLMLIAEEMVGKFFMGVCAALINLSSMHRVCQSADVKLFPHSPEACD